MILAEFYAGIGGMGHSLREAGVSLDDVYAFDINAAALQCYRANDDTIHAANANLDGLTAESLRAAMDGRDADVWTMSPPCQPYTVQGNQLALDDQRSNSFVVLMGILNALQKKPRYFFLENVHGFEGTEAHALLLRTLRANQYSIRQYLLSPSQFGIPNSRLRYYCLACLDRLDDSSEIQREIPIELENTTGSLQQYLGHERVCADTGCRDVYVPDKALCKYSQVFDIVRPSDDHSCCFTKGYTRMYLGTGSVLQTVGDKEALNEVYAKCADVPDEERLSLLRTLGLRYFSPCEIAKISGFPRGFYFPSSVSLKQRYQLLGNSISVSVVSELMKILFAS